MVGTWSVVAQVSWCGEFGHRGWALFPRINNSLEENAMSAAKPRDLILGGNFAGLGGAQEIRKYAGDRVYITVIDR